MKPRIALSLAFLLSACSSASESNVAFAPMSAAARSGVTVYVGETCPSKGTKCVAANGLVQIIGGPTITDGIDNPSKIAVAPSGDVYVGNSTSPETGYVTVYAPGKTAPARTIEHIKGIPYVMAFDPSGNAYIFSHYEYQCCQIRGSGAVYAAGGTTLLRHLSGVGSFPGGAAFDRHGNLYVSNFDDFPGWVSVYAPGATAPSRIIQKGIGFPKALAFDPKGNLYVLNGLFDNGSNIVVYAPGSGGVLRTISEGLLRPSALAFDAKGNLYVANAPFNPAGSSVTVYAAGSGHVSRTIRTGIGNPVALAVDRTGRLFVANAPAKGANTIAVYAAGGTEPEQTYSLQQDVIGFALAPGT